MTLCCKFNTFPNFNQGKVCENVWKLFGITKDVL